MDLNGKSAIVTGGTRGIGRSIAEKFALAGASVAIVGRSADTAGSVADELSSACGATVKGYGVDVGDFDAVQGMVKSIIDEFGKVDILVNNAGITRDNLLMRMTPEEFQDVIDINLGSVFNCTKAVLRPMLKNKGGKIINISSVVGEIGNVGQSNYSASKAAIAGFSRTVAREYGKKGIICNTVAPGYVETDMIKALPQDYLDNIIGQVPLNRLGQAEDIANMVLFLASDLSQYITGQVLKLDGGLTCH